VIERVEPPNVAGEREMLSGWLDFHRATLARKCAGLDAEQLACRSVPPSTLSLLGLVRHLADVERTWFDRVTGRVRDSNYGTEHDPDFDLNGAAADPEQVARAFGDWERAVAESRAVFAGAALEETFEHPRDGTQSVRWVMVHLIEEYARHHGHADLLREAIDGVTGE
jgi:uncharacterized damage-inducible protein DinB